MKKILLIIISLLLLTACESTIYTPTSKVEEYLGKYQKLDKDVLKELDNLIAKEEDMSKEDKTEYKKLLEKQYQNLSYKIKNEVIAKDTATVDVEVEVLDYATSIRKAEKDCEEDNILKCKIKEMKSTNAKTKNELTITLHKEDENWVIEKLTENDVKKLHGLY